jgi:hypothetical protein
MLKMTPRIMSEVGRVTGGRPGRGRGGPFSGRPRAEPAMTRTVRQGAGARTSSDTFWDARTAPSLTITVSS